MSTFKVEVEDLIGSVGDDTLISDSLQAVGSEIVELLPPSKLRLVAKTTSIDVNGTSIGAYKIVGVDKDDFSARQVPAVEKARFKSASSIHKASATSPVYYIENEKIFVIDETGSEVVGILHYVPKIPTSDGSTALVHGATATANFPDDARRLLVLGTALRCLQRLLSDKVTDEDTELTQAIMTQIASIKVLYDKELTLVTGRGGTQQ